MKRFLVYVCFLAGLLPAHPVVAVGAAATVLSAPGCAAWRANPGLAYYDANTAFIEAVKVLTALRQTGKIDDISYGKVSPIIHAVDAALDEWWTALKATPEGETPSVPRTVTQAVTRGLLELAVWQAKFQGGRD